MGANVEIKARCADLAAARERAYELATERLGVDEQVDTSFATARGRLKLRRSSLSGGQLVPTVFGLPLDRSLALPITTIALLVGAISIVVAIVRLGFLDVRFIVRRGLVYGLAAGAVVAAVRGVW